MKNIFGKRTAMLSITAVMLGTFACKDSFLDVPVTGQLTEETLGTAKGIEGLLIGAYAPLNGRAAGWYSGSSNWLWGSIVGGDANKGSNAGDQAVATPVQRFEVEPENGPVGDKWRGMFEGVARSNGAIRVASASKEISDADKKRILGEARFLRGHYYFELRKIFNKVPFVDETVDYAAGADKVTNEAEIWPKIEADFKFAYDNLPEKQAAAGRANKWAAGAYLAKTYLYQKKYADARTLFTTVIDQGQTTNGKKYGLLEKYSDVFNAESDNSRESVFAIQAAANTGSADNANPDFVLNFPYNGGPAGCCGFFQPSFEMANSFRTAGGLPLLDGSYNLPANALKTDQGIQSKDAFAPDAGPLDPRIDHSIGRRGLPYLDWGPHPGLDWIRDQSYGGPFAPKKFIYYKAQEGRLTDGSSWTKGYTAMNYNIIRFADVLLMAAETEAEVGSLAKAQEYVNLVRRRAANAAGFVKKSDGTDAANYVINEYTSAWPNKDAANKAIRFERKLELSGEGHRFFDLVRWGVAATEINAYLAFESTKLPNNLGGARFIPNKHEYMPIPQRQIDLQGADILKQNTGYTQ